MRRKVQRKRSACTQIEDGLIADVLVRLQLPSFSLRIWHCDAKSRDYYHAIDHRSSRQPPTSRTSTHSHTYIHAHYCSRQFTNVHDAFPVSLPFSFSSLSFLSVCAHENLFRNCIKGTFAPGYLSGRFRSGRVQSGLVSALREISPFARVSAFSVVVRPSNFAFRFRPWIAAEAARFSAFARVASDSSLAHRRI